MDDQSPGAGEQDNATGEAGKSQAENNDALAASATSNLERSREELIRTKSELEEEQIQASHSDEQSPSE